MNNQEDLQRIKALRLIDDEFMSVCFDNYIEGAELLLKVILDREDLKVSEVRTQKAIKNLQGRDVWLFSPFAILTVASKVDGNCVSFSSE